MKTDQIFNAFLKAMLIVVLWYIVDTLHDITQTLDILQHTLKETTKIETTGV